MRVDGDPLHTGKGLEGPSVHQHTPKTNPEYSFCYRTMFSEEIVVSKVEAHLLSRVIFSPINSWSIVRDVQDHYCLLHD